MSLNCKPLKPEDLNAFSARLREGIKLDVITPEYAAQLLGYDREEMPGTFYLATGLVLLNASGELAQTPGVSGDAQGSEGAAVSEPVPGS